MEVKWEIRSLYLFDTVILGFLTILKNCQAWYGWAAKVNQSIYRSRIVSGSFYLQKSFDLCSGTLCPSPLSSPSPEGSQSQVPYLEGS